MQHRTSKRAHCFHEILANMHLAYMPCWYQHLVSGEIYWNDLYVCLPAASSTSIVLYQDPRIIFPDIFRAFFRIQLLSSGYHGVLFASHFGLPSFPTDKYLFPPPEMWHGNDLLTQIYIWITNNHLISWFHLRVRGTCEWEWTQQIPNVDVEFYLSLTVCPIQLQCLWLRYLNYTMLCVFTFTLELSRYLNEL